jgi:predicted transposase YbfD/YdcC
MFELTHETRYYVASFADTAPAFATRIRGYWGVENKVHYVRDVKRYYLLSIEPDVQRFAQSVRSHWSIENQLHWVLDVGFSEDKVQSYTANG